MCLYFWCPMTLVWAFVRLAVKCMNYVMTFLCLDLGKIYPALILFNMFESQTGIQITVFYLKLLWRKQIMLTSVPVSCQYSNIVYIKNSIQMYIHEMVICKGRKSMRWQWWGLCGVYSLNCIPLSWKEKYTDAVFHAFQRGVYCSLSLIYYCRGSGTYWNNGIL